MRQLKILFDKNKEWAKKRLEADPNVFLKQAESQSPSYLWIGCSDSRVPANEILGLDPGHLFVHRNLANLFPHTDFNCLSVLEYGVETLGIEHVIVCGHYGCGGVRAAMEKEQFGLVDNWLRHIRDVSHRECKELEGIADEKRRWNRLVELNVIYQVMSICHTTIAQNRWAKGKTLCIHGWVYDIATGHLKDLDCCIASIDQINEAYRTFKFK